MVDACKVIAFGAICGLIIYTSFKTDYIPIRKFRRYILSLKYEETFGFPPYDLSPEKIKDSLRNHKRIQKRIQT